MSAYYFAFLDQSNLDLARIELSNFTEVVDLEGSPFLLTKAFSYPYLAYTRYYGQYFGVFDDVNDLDLSFLKNLKVSLKILGKRKEAGVLQKELSKKFEFDLLFPKNRNSVLNDSIEKILIYFKEEKVFLGRVIWERPSFKDREPINRPFNRPYSLKPKFARALVNLANEDFIVDPFLGTGTILIEADYTNRNYLGIDKDWKAVKGAIKNFKYFGLKKRIVLSNAFYIDKLIKKPFSVVTDPPYGKSSTSFKESIYNIYYNFIESFFNSEISKKLVIIAPEHQEEVIDLLRTYNPKFEIRHRVNSSLNRIIFLIEKEI